DREGDHRQQLDADPVRAAQAAGIAGLLELGVDPRHRAALLAAPDARQALDHRPDDALVERLLQLELLQRLGLDDELAEPRLDGVLRWAGGDAVGDEQDGDRRHDGDEDFRGHGHYTLMSTMRRMNR